MRILEMYKCEIEVSAIDPAVAFSVVENEEIEKVNEMLKHVLKAI